MWPQIVHLNEVQSRLINDGFPIERAMRLTSEMGQLQLGDRFRLERTQGNLLFYAQGAGMFITAAE